jgi:signal transduction histidine kinase
VEERLQEYSERLEEMVEERTQELRDAQEQLVRREKLAILGQLAGGVGHELRNPLGVISNAVYFLQMVLFDADESVKESLEMISEEVCNSAKIISDLLDFSRTRMPDREEVVVSELVAQVLEKRPPPGNVEVITEIAPDLPPVFVDPRQMGQVLGNLVTNVYQAMKEGGNLTFRARAERGQVSLSVADTGCGIPPENMTRLFEPLFTTKTRGIGLGLAVSKSLVEANEGSIEVESEEGRGSTFTVKLPIWEGVA